MVTRTQNLPEKYHNIDDIELIDRIQKIKSKLGKRLVILGHHYQRKEVVALADFKGDSFQLSRIASQQAEAKYIIFCGVRFMAESAAVLARPDQVVIHPDVDAGCPMAELAPIDKVTASWEKMSEDLGSKKVTPVLYINSDVELKAFVGRHGGTICTSSNANKAIHWGLQQGDKVFFLPDKNLGLNTARQLALPTEQVLTLNSATDTTYLTSEEYSLPAFHQAKLILWNGYCHVHTWFRAEQVKKFRQKYPQAKVVVHPECNEEVVQLADAVGSTKFIVEYVQQAPSGTVIVIGTELNLVSRLADENPDKTILPLAVSPCPNMWKISLNDLYWVLDNLGEVNVVTIPKEIKNDAQTALQRMMKLE